MNFLNKLDVRMEYAPDANIGDDFDTYIIGLMNYVESLWDEMTMRTWFQTTHTEYYDGEKFQSVLLLKNYPVSSITTIHDDPDHDFEDADLIDSDDYFIGDGKDGIVTYDGDFYEGRKNIKVVYVAGYTGSTLPRWTKQIMIRQCTHWLYQAENHNWHVGGESTGAGSINFNVLKDNLLPDFVMLAERNRRR